MIQKEDRVVQKFLKKSLDRLNFLQLNLIKLNLPKVFLSVVLVVTLSVKTVAWPVGQDHNTILATEFYFVRHGQTDYNAGLIKGVYGDIPLNVVGQRQVSFLRRFIETLPIKTICCSPLLRARQTAEVINARLGLPCMVISDLREGSCQDWTDIKIFHNKKDVPLSKNFKKFLTRVDRGLQKVLRQQGPVLIVAHGGVYCALCRVLGCDLGDWPIANCTVIRFYKNIDGSWSLEHLFETAIGNVFNKSFQQIV